MPYPGYTTEEVGRRGRELYETKLRAQIEPAHTGKFLVLDIVTGDYEIAEDDLAASDRLLARNPARCCMACALGRPQPIVSGATPWERARDPRNRQSRSES